MASTQERILTVAQLRRSAITEELPPIDWREVHRLGLEGPAYLEARLAGTLTAAQRSAADAVTIVHFARNLRPGHPDYARRRREALAVGHLVPFRTGPSGRLDR